MAFRIFGRPKTYFFTELDKLNSQDYSGAFGRRSDTEYRVCSNHTATSTSKAIAITDGLLFAVEQDADHFNLVLRPASSVCDFLPNIYCFVYKGVKKTSLITADGKYIAAEFSNDITTKIYENRRRFHESSGKDTEFDPNIPYYIIQPYDDDDGGNCLREIMRSEEYSQPIIVTAGDHLGDFDPGSFALEIILERWEMSLTLDTVRKGDHMIEVEGLGFMPSELEKFRDAVAREEILNYMDPAAFYGSFYRQEGKNKLHYIENGEEKSANRLDLYNSVISKFYNKDKQYIDIRNSLNYSMNLFDNLSNELYLGLGSAISISLKTFNYRNDGWPMLTIDSGDFYTQNDLIRIQLPVEDDMPYPELFFIGDTYLNLGIDRNYGEVNGRFIRVVKDGQMTAAFQFRTPRKEDDLKPVASYTRIVYSSRYDDLYSDVIDFSSNIHLVNHYLDQLFIPFEIDSVLHVSERMTVDVIYDNRLIAYNPMFNSNAFAAERGVAVGTDVITFFAYPYLRSLGNSLYNNIQLTSLITRDYTNLFEKFEDQYATVRTETGYLEFSTRDAVPYYNLVQVKNRRSQDPELSELITLTLTHEEYNEIKTLKESSGFVDYLPVYFGVVLYEIRATDKHGNIFDRYELVLRGLAEVDGEIVTKEVETGKMITHVYKN